MQGKGVFGEGRRDCSDPWGSGTRTVCDIGDEFVFGEPEGEGIVFAFCLKC